MLTASASRMSRLAPHIQVCRPTILCVDDDPDVTRSIEMRLKAFDVTVNCALHGMQGIWKSALARPDLIIMDLAMPKGDGRFALRCLRANAVTKAVPIIVLTGMRDPALAIKLIDEGADAFLRKPISFNELLECISRFIDLRPPRGSSEGFADDAI